MVNSEELNGTTEYLTMQTACRINRCRYNWDRLYNLVIFSVLSSKFTCFVRDYGTRGNEDYKSLL